MRRTESGGNESEHLLTDRERHRADILVSIPALDQGFRAALDAALDATLVVDPEGRIVLANQLAFTSFGYEASEILGASVDMLVPDRLRTSHAAHRAAFNEEPRRREMGEGLALHGRRKDGSEFPVEVSLSPILLAEGLHTVCAVRDVTERLRSDAAVVRLNAELDRRVQERTAQLESANRELEAFTYTVSHDLRAPLRAMEGFSRILLEEYAPKLDQDAKHYLERVRAGALRMGQLVDDLLAFTRIGRQPLSVTPIRPALIVSRVLQDFQAEIEARKVTVAVEDLPACHADPILLQQVYANLIGNALKFTRGRSDALVTVGCHNGHSAEIEAIDDRNHVYFVRDNGVGFEMAYVDKLFGVFQRLHAAADYEGTGVGLAIVHRIVTRMGGRIWAAGAVDEGATISFTLPPAEEVTA
jgi:PAS domain S-box-containing protein